MAYISDRGLAPATPSAWRHPPPCGLGSAYGLWISPGLAQDMEPPTVMIKYEGMDVLVIAKPDFTMGVIKR